MDHPNIARVLDAGATDSGRPYFVMELIGSIPAEMLPASLATASLLRTLGVWHALRGEWRPAADRFVTLPAMRVPAESLDPRRAAVERFALSSKEIVAEHVLKSCLLMPADAATLKGLAPLTQIATNFLRDPQNDLTLAGWQVVALGLYEYRRGDFKAAVEWTRKYSAYRSHNPSRSALAHSVLALAYHQLDDTERAQAELARTRELVEPRFPLTMGEWAQGYWFDWLIAQTLLREASAMIDPG